MYKLTKALIRLRPVRLRLDREQTYLEVDYKPSSENPMFDICDLDGRIIKTGKFQRGRLKVKVSDLISQAYVFLILDGEQIKSTRFDISRQV
jgi:hypothetical protein